MAEVREDNGIDGEDEITEIRINPGRERTLEEEKNLLARLLAEGSVGHDGWLIPLMHEGVKGGGNNAQRKAVRRRG